MALSVLKIAWTRDDCSVIDNLSRQFEPVRSEVDGFRHQGLSQLTLNRKCPLLYIGGPGSIFPYIQTLLAS